MKNKRFLIGNVLVLVACLAFYSLFWTFGETIVTKDAPSYINMALSREPFYPSFLAFFRMLFGTSTDKWLIAVTFVQSILQAICTYFFIRFFRKHFNAGAFLTAVLTMLCFLVSLLLQFAAKRSYMYNNSIMTEAICIPLFLLFAVLVMEYLFSLKVRYLVGASIVSLIMLSSRKQMYITLILLAGIIIFAEYKRFKDKGNKKVVSFGKSFLVLLVTVAMILGVNKGFEAGYNYFVNGEAAEHFNDDRFLTTVIFYVAEPEDAEAIEDPEIKQLFGEIYAICDSEGSMMHSAEGSIYDKVTHFAEHYDMIQINHMWNMIEDYARTKIGDDANGIKRETYVDEISSIISYSIMPNVWPKLLKLFGMNVVEGLSNSLAKSSPMFYIYSFVMVGLYILLLIVNIVRRGWNKVNKLGIYSIFALFGNVCLVSLLIFCQSRYMIYNMPLFYAAFLMLVLDTLKGKEKDVRN